MKKNYKIAFLIGVMLQHGFSQENQGLDIQIEGKWGDPQEVLLGGDFQIKTKLEASLAFSSEYSKFSFYSARYNPLVYNPIKVDYDIDGFCVKGDDLWFVIIPKPEGSIMTFINAKDSEVYFLSTPWLTVDKETLVALGDEAHLIKTEEAAVDLATQKYEAVTKTVLDMKKTEVKTYLVKRSTINDELDIKSKSEYFWVVEFTSGHEFAVDSNNKYIMRANANSEFFDILLSQNLKTNQ